MATLTATKTHYLKIYLNRYLTTIWKVAQSTIWTISLQVFFPSVEIILPQWVLPDGGISRLWELREAPDVVPHPLHLAGPHRGHQGAKCWVPPHRTQEILVGTNPLEEEKKNVQEHPECSRRGPREAAEVPSAVGRAQRPGLGGRWAEATQSNLGHPAEKFQHESQHSQGSHRNMAAHLASLCHSQPSLLVNSQQLWGKFTWTFTKPFQWCSCPPRLPTQIHLPIFHRYKFFLITPFLLS